MTDAIYKRTQARVERRLSHSARLAVLNALLFTLFTVPLGLITWLMPPVGAMNGVVYWIAFFWSILLFVQVANIFFRSGAWKSLRERSIQEEVLDTGDAHDLVEDELVALHQRIDDDITRQSQPIMRLMINATGNLLLWPGLMVVLLVIQRLMANKSDFWLVISSGFFLALMGTLALGLMLPLNTLRQTRQRNDLHRIYGYKRKRRADEPAEKAKVATIGADGELEFADDPPVDQIENEPPAQHQQA